MAGGGVLGSLEFTLPCGEVYFRYQLVFAHVSSSFSVYSPGRLYFWGKSSQLTGFPNLYLGDSIGGKKFVSFSFCF